MSIYFAKNILVVIANYGCRRALRNDIIYLYMIFIIYDIEYMNLEYKINI